MTRIDGQLSRDVSIYYHEGQFPRGFTGCFAHFHQERVYIHSFDDLKSPVSDARRGDCSSLFTAKNITFLPYQPGSLEKRRTNCDFPKGNDSIESILCLEDFGGKKCLLHVGWFLWLG